VREEYIAKVDNEFLSEEYLDKSLSSEKYESKHREEFIREWVKNHVLYLEAKKNGLLEDEEFISITADLKKQLLAAMLLKNVSDDLYFNFDERDLQKYYEENKNEFRLNTDAVVFNKISFNNRDKAIQFRSVLLDTDWNKSLNVFIGDNSVLDYDTEKLFYLHDIYPQTLLRYLINLKPMEASIVFEPEPKQFTIVQVKSKFKKDELPGFAQIKEIVSQRYVLHQRKKHLAKYIEELIPQYSIEIKR